MLIKKQAYAGEVKVLQTDQRGCVPQTHQTPACLRTFALAIPLPEPDENLDMYMLRGPLRSGRQTSEVVQVWFQTTSVKQILQ